MVGVLAVVLGVSPFFSVDGGYRAEPRVPVAHRTIEVFAPTQPGLVIASAGDAPQTRLGLSIEATTAASLSDAGLLLGGATQLEIIDPLTLRITRAGSVTVSLDHLVTRHVGETRFVDLPGASFALIPSAPFETLSTGALRVVAASATIDVRLQVSGPPIPWPSLGGQQSWGASMVWDAARGRVLRVGGGDAFALEEGTFVWDLITGWQRLPIASPPPRVRASLAYDSSRQRAVLFGGLGAQGLLADTWEFDGTQWTEVTPVTGPRSRWSHGAAFDEDLGVMILFGGLAGPDSSDFELGDTWAWDGFTWTQLQPATSPVPRDAFGMTWDGTRRRVTLAAGWDGVDRIGDAWVWVGGTWQQIAPVPINTASTALAWSQLTGDLVLTGGWDPRGGPLFYASTYRFNGTTWTSGPSLPQPAARMALVGHPTLGVLMHGGRNANGFTGVTARLEPVWQRLPQGDRDERALFQAGLIAGERYVWAPLRNPLRDPMRVKWPVPDGTTAVAMTSTNFYGVSDGGLRGWDMQTSAEIAAPPPFREFGWDLNTLWVVDLDGGLQQGNSTEWRLIAPVPAGLHGLRLKTSPTAEFFAWSPTGLQVWSPLDGGLISLGAPLIIDGGVQLSPLGFGVSAVGAVGTWHAAPDGSWVAFPLPRLEEPLVDGVIVTDAGIAEYRYLKPIGARCDDRQACAEGECINGRCCSSRCAACEVCSIEAGGMVDGHCTPAPRGMPCFDAGCAVVVCDGLSLSCRVPTTSLCPPDDAGVDPVDDAGVGPVDDAGVETMGDAGTSSPDAGGSQVPPEPKPPSGCGCSSGAEAVWLLAALVFSRRRSRARRPS